MFDRRDRGRVVKTLFSQVVSRCIETMLGNVFYHDLGVKGKVKEITTDVRQKRSWSSGEDTVLSSGQSMHRNHIREFFYHDLRVKGKVKEITTGVRQKRSWSSGEDIVLSSGQSMHRNQVGVCFLS